MPGTPVGSMPVGSEETRLGLLRETFGTACGTERIELQVQSFGSRVSRALKLDWMLPHEDVERPIAASLG